MVIGYTDMPSRLAGQSSNLYANNISKYLLSMGPFTTGAAHVDFEGGSQRGRRAALHGACTPGSCLSYCMLSRQLGEAFGWEHGVRACA